MELLQISLLLKGLIILIGIIGTEATTTFDTGSLKFTVSDNVTPYSGVEQACADVGSSEVRIQSDVEFDLVRNQIASDYSFHGKRMWINLTRVRDPSTDAVTYDWPSGTAVSSTKFVTYYGEPDGDFTSCPQADELCIAMTMSYNGVNFGAYHLFDLCCNTWLYYLCNFVEPEVNSGGSDGAVTNSDTDTTEKLETTEKLVETTTEIVETTQSTSETRESSAAWGSSSAYKGPYLVKEEESQSGVTLHCKVTLTKGEVQAYSWFLDGGEYLQGPNNDEAPTNSTITISSTDAYWCGWFACAAQIAVDEATINTNNSEELHVAFYATPTVTAATTRFNCEDTVLLTCTTDETNITAIQSYTWNFFNVDLDEQQITNVVYGEDKRALKLKGFLHDNVGLYSCAIVYWDGGVSFYSEDVDITFITFRPTLNWKKADGSFIEFDCVHDSCDGSVDRYQLVKSYGKEAEVYLNANGTWLLDVSEDEINSASFKCAVFWTSMRSNLSDELIIAEATKVVSENSIAATAKPQTTLPMELSTSLQSSAMSKEPTVESSLETIELSTSQQRRITSNERTLVSSVATIELPTSEESSAMLDERTFLSSMVSTFNTNDIVETLSLALSNLGPATLSAWRTVTTLEASILPSRTEALETSGLSTSSPNTTTESSAWPITWLVEPVLVATALTVEQNTEVSLICGTTEVEVNLTDVLYHFVRHPDEMSFEVGQQNSSILVIENFDKASEGQYKCAISRGEDVVSHVSNIVTLTLASWWNSRSDSDGDHPKPTLDASSSMPDHGSSLSLECLSDKADNVSMYYVFHENFVLMKSPDNSVYIIDNFTEDDGGNYSCATKHTDGVLSPLSDIVLIQSPPIALPGNTELTSSQNVISTEPSISPSRTEASDPIVTTTPVLPSGENSDRLNTQTLTSREDSVVSTTAEALAPSGLLTPASVFATTSSPSVEGSDRPLASWMDAPVLVATALNVEPNASVSLICNTKELANELTNAVYTYYFSITLSDGDVIVYYQRNSKFTIGNFDNTANEEFQCKIEFEGQFSQESNTIFLTSDLTNEDPTTKPMLESNSTTPDYGDSVKLTCLVNDPRLVPTMYYVFHEGNILHKSLNTNVYIITNFNEEDIGEYSCAINVDGLLSPLSDLVSIQSPNSPMESTTESMTFTDQPVLVSTAIYVEADASVSLICCAAESVMANVSDALYHWYLNGLYLTGRMTPTMEISHFDSNSEGEYGCKTSSSGITSPVSNMVVLHPVSSYQQHDIYPTQPTLVSNPSPPEYQIPLGLDCLSDEADPDVTYYIFYAEMLLKTSRDSHVHIIDEFTENNNGDYSCAVSLDGYFSPLSNVIALNVTPAIETTELPVTTNTPTLTTDVSNISTTDASSSTNAITNTPILTTDASENNSTTDNALSVTNTTDTTHTSTSDVSEMSTTEDVTLSTATYPTLNASKPTLSSSSTALYVGYSLTLSCRSPRKDIAEYSVVKNGLTRHLIYRGPSQDATIASVSLFHSGQYVCKFKTTRGTKSKPSDVIYVDVIPVDSVCYCPCPTHVASPNVTDSEVEGLRSSIKKELSVDVAQLSATVSKYVSKKDARASSNGLGALGIALLSLVFGALIFADCINVYQSAVDVFRRKKEALAKPRYQ